MTNKVIVNPTWWPNTDSPMQKAAPWKEIVAGKYLFKFNKVIKTYEKPLPPNAYSGGNGVLVELEIVGGFQLSIGKTIALYISDTTYKVDGTVDQFKYNKTWSEIQQIFAEPNRETTWESLEAFFTAQVLNNLADGTLTWADDKKDITKKYANIQWDVLSSKKLVAPKAQAGAVETPSATFEPAI